jgi:hypothetical protein
MSLQNPSRIKAVAQRKWRTERKKIGISMTPDDGTARGLGIEPLYPATCVTISWLHLNRADRRFQALDFSTLIDWLRRAISNTATKFALH